MPVGMLSAVTVSEPALSCPSLTVAIVCVAAGAPALMFAEPPRMVGGVF